MKLNFYFVFPYFLVNLSGLPKTWRCPAAVARRWQQGAMVQVQAHEEAAKGMTTLPDPIGAVTLAPPSML